MAKVCVLLNQFISSLKGAEIFSLYIILPSFIKIGQELFEIIWEQTHRHTDTHTDRHIHRHIHADENKAVQEQSFWDR